MAGQPQLRAQAGSKLTQPWADFISKTGVSPAAVSLGWKGGSQAVAVIDVNYSDLADSMQGGPAQVQGLLQNIVGWAVRVPPPAGGPTAGTIRRVLPVAHPLLLNYFAQRVSRMEFYGPNGKRLGNTPYYSLNASADWRNARLYVQFESLPYVVTDDGTISRTPYNGRELGRFVEGPYYDPAVAAIQRPPLANGGFQWPPGAPLPGDSPYLQFGVTQLRGRGIIRLVWHQVPEDSLFSAGPFPGMPGIPTNCWGTNSPMGKVNADTFLGIAPGLLRFEPVRLTPVPSPFPVNSNVNYPQRLWDCEYRLAFDEDGWQTVPNPRDNQNYQIFVQSGGATSYLYKTATFASYVCQSL